MKAATAVLIATACAAPPAATPVAPAAAPKPAPAPARAAAPASSPAPLIRPCASGSAEADKAAAAVAALGKQIAALAPDADPAPVNAAMTELLATPCFALATIVVSGDAADSARALKRFWDDGGQWWLESQLLLATDRRSVFPATMRKTLRADHPLACPAADATCGTATRGWQYRAETTFERMAKANRVDDQEADTGERDRPDIPPSQARCAAEAKRAPAGDRFPLWLDCVRRLGVRHVALPLGDTRAPTTGWLVLRGRRGHYQFCDEIRAYDMATGSAFVASSCSGLALSGDGSVDHRQTDAGRGLGVVQGMLSIDTLRETAWMILLAGETQRDVTDAHAFTLPAGVEPEAGQVGFGSIGVGSVSFSSNQTQLAWSYLVGGKSVASGTLTWPGDYNDDARQYAVELIEIAEASLVTGCARARPPRRLDFGVDHPGVSRLDADVTSLSKAENALVDSLAAAKLKRCRR